MNLRASSSKRLAAAAVLAIACCSLAALPAHAQTGVLFVEGNRVGVGTATPETPLEVQSSAGDAQFLVEELSATAASRTMFTLRNNGGIRFGMVNSVAGSIWQFAALANFNIDFNGNPGNELQVRQNGDLAIGGVLLQGSSKELKTSFGPLDPQEALRRLQSLPIEVWSYRTDPRGSRHLGPYAEDFHRVFELGEEKLLAPGDQVGVALLAIKGLQEQVQEKDRQIDELTRRLERLEAALATADAAR